MTRTPAIWISWERHRRSREICRALDVPLFEITSDGAGALRYVSLLLRTALCIARRRPRVLFVQCPSIVLGVWAVCLKLVWRYTLVADLHNEAVEPFIHSFPGYRGMIGLIKRTADVSLVSNAGLADSVTRSGGTAYVLPDKVPEMSVPSPAAAAGPARRVVFICTFAPDEPYGSVIEAAALLGSSVEVAVTGDYRRLEPPLDVPAHVRLTGFLPQSEYDQLLRDADVLVDLTAMENCLVCGAYEAVALEKPLVTSDTAALRRHFHRGAVYTTHDPAALAAAIAQALHQRTALASEMKHLRMQLSDAWAEQKGNLARRLCLGS
jgi:glycosyltransferase involved in cell wall biosynthesis